MLETRGKKEKERPLHTTNNWAKLLLANNYSNDWRHWILRVPPSPSSLPRRMISLTKGQRNPRNKRKQKGRCTLRFAASDGFESDREKFDRYWRKISSRFRSIMHFLEENVNSSFFQKRINKWNFLVINFKSFWIVFFLLKFLYLYIICSMF